MKYTDVSWFEVILKNRHQYVAIYACHSHVFKAEILTQYCRKAAYSCENFDNTSRNDADFNISETNCIELTAF